MVALVSCGDLRQEHTFNPLDSLDPIQTMKLMSGDWTAILPESVRGIARSLLGKEEDEGPMGMLSKAQGLLGGGDSDSGLGSLLGGLSGGDGDSTKNSLISGFSSLMNKDSDDSGILSTLGNLVSHQNQVQKQ